MKNRRIFIQQSAAALVGVLVNTKSKAFMEKNNQYEIIIIGGSYAGLAAAMALGRALRKVLIIDSGQPCNASTPYSHNFLTNDGKTPRQVAAVAEDQVLKYPSVNLIDDTAIAAEKSEGEFTVKTAKGGLYKAEKFLFATGVKDIMLPIPGFTECWGKTVIHCPYCHGYEVRGQKTGILANGDTAIELAMLISNWTRDLTIYTNAKSLIADVLGLQKHNIRVVETEIERLEHNNGSVHAIQFKDGSMAQVNAIYTRPAFKQHSETPETLGCEITTSGYIKIDNAQRTSVPGVFACGDNTSRMRTLANAVAQGTLTGMMLNKELIEENF